MLGKLARALLIGAVVGSAVAVPAALAAPGPAIHIVAKVAPKQFFAGLVNAKTHKAVLHVVCPGAANFGHPLAHESVQVNLFLPPVTPAFGYTGTAGTSIEVWLNWPAAAPPAPVYVATFTSYRSAPIPTSIKVPCSGSGEMLFLPAPGSPTVKAATVDLTFVNIGV
jgi:hypothetical protein